MLKTSSITKSKPQKITYTDYKNFDSVRFNDKLKYVLAKEKITSCTKFDEMFLGILNKHAPRKSRIIYFQNFKKNHHEEVLPRKSIFQKTHRPFPKKFQKTKSYCSRLYKRVRKDFFNKLNTSFVSDNKLFCKTVKPYFSAKGSHRGNIKLVKGDKLLQDDSEVAEELNNFFKEAVSTLDVNENSYIIKPTL